MRGLDLSSLTSPIGLAAGNQASSSMIQRQFKIGYNRAARMIEVMEQEEVVGPADGSRPRQVLVGQTG